MLQLAPTIVAPIADKDRYIGPAEQLECLPKEPQRFFIVRRTFPKRVEKPYIFTHFFSYMLDCCAALFLYFVICLTTHRL